MQKLNLRGNQKGFTLVEVAIVLVIIGLLIGGILKGQEMIQNARIKRVEKQADELRAAISAYQDRYGTLPGDDLNPVGHTGVAGLIAGNGNGLIAAAEAPDLFMHLAATNLISGTYTVAAASYPRNAFGGTTDIEFQPVATLAPVHWIVFTQIPAEAARIIDTSLDDGVDTTGTIRANAAYLNNTTVTLYIQL